MALFARALALASLSCAVLACTAPETPVESASDLSAPDFERAAAKLADLTYGRWDYLPTGCFARAFYLSMELAAEGIATNHVYAHAKAVPLAGRWGFHVVPGVTKAGEDQLYVFDPALAPGKVITVKEWVTLQGFPNPAAVQYPRVRVTAGTSYWDLKSGTDVTDIAAPSAAVYGEPTFEGMPRFSMESLNDACRWMHGTLPGGSPETTSEQHRAVAAATVRLVRALGARHKIDGTEAQIDPKCLSGDYR